MKPFYFILSIALTVVVGVGAGFAWGSSTKTSNSSANSANSNHSVHTMSDGSVMSDESMSMDAMMAVMSADLQGKTGSEFDKAFLESMIVHHEGAVDMAEQALQYAEHQEIIDLATDIIEAQNAEISEMKSWQTNWY